MATRVLIVDDHRMFADSLRALLTASGIEVTGLAATGADAEAAVRRSPPDVALVDFNLPDTDGATLTRSLLGATPGVRVVMLTGSGSDGTVMQAIEAGCTGFVDKTSTADTLVASIDRVMAGEVLFSASVLSRAITQARRPGLQLGGDLTPREREVLALLAAGRATDDIADELGLSVHTVRTHIQSILEKLDAHSKLEAVAISLREGLISVG